MGPRQRRCWSRRRRQTPRPDGMSCFYAMAASHAGSSLRIQQYRQVEAAMLCLPGAAAPVLCRRTSGYSTEQARFLPVAPCRRACEMAAPHLSDRKPWQRLATSLMPLALHVLPSTGDCATLSRPRSRLPNRPAHFPLCGYGKPRRAILRMGDDESSAFARRSAAWRADERSRQCGQ